MEKVKIKICVKKETSKGVYYAIELEDGRTGMSSENLTEYVGQEKEFIIKEGKLYNNKMQYYFNLPKESKGKGFFKKDYTFGKGRAIKNFATYIDRKMIKNIIEAHQNFLFNMIDNSILAELKSLKPEYLPNLKCSDEAKQFIDSFISSWKDYKETGEGSIVVINFDNNIKQIHRAMVN